MTRRPAALRAAPAEGAALRDAIYAGQLLRALASAASRRLAARARAAVVEAFAGAAPTPESAPVSGGSPPDPFTRARRAWRRLPAPEHYARLGAARAALARDPEVLAAAWDLLAALDLDGCALDPPRLRAVTPDGHALPAAAAAYGAHRDCWYANPRAQLNLWLPLHAVGVADSFALDLGAFGSPVANDSAAFDLDGFSAQGGFQSARAAATAHFPAATDPGRPTTAERVPALGADEVLVFSAAHLHRTLPNQGVATRFSLDLRAVHLGDHAAGRGAPCPDDASRGDALGAYLRPARGRGRSPSEGVA